MMQIDAALFSYNISQSETGRITIQDVFWDLALPKAGVGSNDFYYTVYLSFNPNECDTRHTIKVSVIDPDGAYAGGQTTDLPIELVVNPTDNYGYCRHHLKLGMAFKREGAYTAQIWIDGDITHVTRLDVKIGADHEPIDRQRAKT